MNLIPLLISGSYITKLKIKIPGSDDKSVIIWDTKRGLPLTSLQLHYSVINIEPSSDFSRISVLLKDLQYMPIICLHNTPAKYVKLPTYCAPDKDIIESELWTWVAAGGATFTQRTIVFQIQSRLLRDR